MSQWYIRERLHRWFGWHWWKEHYVWPTAGKTHTDVRVCLLCPTKQRQERNYDPRRGHWYKWITITDFPSE